MLTKKLTKQGFKNINRMVGNFKINFLDSEAQSVAENRDVQLRGIQIRGKFNDLPNLIFFPDTFDQVENWMPFFTNPQNNFLDYRNVHILYPRNFGNSDRNEDMSSKAVADDVARYMYNNNFTCATLGGHGLGAAFALRAAIEHYDRTSGFFAIDYTPVNYNHYQVVRDLIALLKRLSDVNLSTSKGAIFAQINHCTEDEKWRSVFRQNIHRGASGAWEWTFDMDTLLTNLTAPGMDSIASWNSGEGIYPGRSTFIYPENSDYFHIGTNTLPIYKTCAPNRGLNRDIFSLQCEENSQSHWVYEIPELRRAVADRLGDFLRLYDGVHVLNTDRTTITTEFIPERSNVKETTVYSDRTMPHYHHNWRYNL